MENKPKQAGAGFTMPPQMIISLLKSLLKGKTKTQIILIICLYCLITGVGINAYWLIEVLSYLF